MLFTTPFSPLSLLSILLFELYNGDCDDEGGTDDGGADDDGEDNDNDGHDDGHGDDVDHGDDSYLSL